jgi:hypothetical protein
MHGWKMGLPVAAFVASVTMARMVIAGGFGLSVILPQPEDDARLRECVLVYRAAGCHAVNGSVTAKFEGMVNGKRVTLPTEKVATIVHVPNERIPGMDAYGLMPPKLPDGKWVLSITATSGMTIKLSKNGKPTGETIRPTITQLVPFQADGTPVTRANPGAKYETAVVAHSVSSSDRDKILAQLLKAPATPAVAAIVTAPR